MKRSGVRFEDFCLKVVLNRRAKKVSFLLILPYKTMLPDGLETSGQRAYR